ncbi:hypothetical protein B4168_0986 [Anoxybacillus flavithermus]|nr:hypothetical protein B4168_0986 [Anoxybacillus flavithermus]OAO86993.1 hypothetical protein GT23_2011 [Parageobacillus thermoglucosidasius]
MIFYVNYNHQYFKIAYSFLHNFLSNNQTKRVSHFHTMG